MFPKFDSSDSHVYFYLVETYFTRHQTISEQHKTNTVKLHLPSVETTRLRDFIVHYHGDKPYLTLKNALIDHHGYSSTHSVKNLSSDKQQLSMSKPSKAHPKIPFNQVFKQHNPYTTLSTMKMDIEEFELIPETVQCLNFDSEVIPKPRQPSTPSKPSNNFPICSSKQGELHKQTISVNISSGTTNGSSFNQRLADALTCSVAYGTFMAAEVAYYTYIYAKVPKEYYPQVTAHTRAAILAGRCLSGTIAQVLLEFDVMDYKSLNYITFSAMITATIWSLFLPSVPKSIYFHRDPEKQSLTSKGKYQSAFALMKSHFVESFSNSYVAKWSIWWALATSGFIQVQTYMQPLWSDIHTVPNSTLHNGTVEAVLTLVGCLGALSIGFIKTDWKVRGELVLSLCSILSGALLIISSQTSHIIVSYACYVVFGGLYHFVITIATSEVAKYILEDSYGIVFGLNTLIALVLQTLVTLCLVTGDIGWALTPRNQHLAYGIYHMCIAVVFIIIGIVDWLRNQADITKTY